MAQITGQAGVNLSTELANYLSANQGNLTSEQLSQIINQYLTGGDKIAAQGGSISTGIYKRFGEFDQVTGKVEVVTTAMWSGDAAQLNEFYTSPTQITSSGDYYYNVYNLDPAISTSAEIQFAVAYGHKEGSGSATLDVNPDSTLATKATYAQYKQILLEQDDSYFTFTSASGDLLHDSDDIYVINISRARYKEKMDAQNWELTLSGSISSSVTFIDDSDKKFSDAAGKAGRVFNIVEGQLNLGSQNGASSGSIQAPNGEGYGLFYPDQGLMILNPSALASKVGGELSGSLSTAAEQQNHQYLFNAIKDGADFDARRTENVSTSHYFVRATNREYNYSNNPTFVSGTDGSFSESTFETDPKTFITTVGLYNDSNELLAVSKTSQPIAKSFDKEVLIKVKLDF